jgi:YHS domain-containing protein
MLTTLIATLSFANQGVATICPVGGHDAAGGTQMLYKGVVYSLCCDDCIAPFKAEPDKYVKGREGKDLIGVANFDVVSKKAIDVKRATIFSDYAGVRYYFASAQNKSAFDKDAKKATTAPDKEGIEKCPVMGEALNLRKMSNYADYEGVRYYFCCAGCSTPFSKDPKRYSATVTPTKSAAHQLPS